MLSKNTQIIMQYLSGNVNPTLDKRIMEKTAADILSRKLGCKVRNAK